MPLTVNIKDISRNCHFESAVETLPVTMPIGHQIPIVLTAVIVMSGVRTGAKYLNFCWCLPCCTGYIAVRGIVVSGLDCMRGKCLIPEGACRGDI